MGGGGVDLRAGASVLLISGREKGVLSSFVNMWSADD